MTAVGLPLDRVDGPLKVTGAADYAADIRPAGLVHAVLLGSSVARGRVTHIDASAAERVEGVLGVFTHESLKLRRMAGAPRG
jgi:xanthine dehydrogenase YagR molybdenum-binding subunit